MHHSTILHCLAWQATAIQQRQPHSLSAWRASSYRHRSPILLTDANSSKFDIDTASAGIRKELYANDVQIKEMIARAESRRLTQVNNDNADVPSLLDRVALAARIEPAYLIVALGALLFVYLNRAAKDLTMLAFESPEADVAAARSLALVGFAIVQRAAGFEFSGWLRLSGDSASSDGSSGESAGLLDPLLALPTPIAGIACAALIAVPVAGLSASGVDLLPVYGTGFPTGDRALLTLLIAPLSEEVFFRAWLLSAFERAGGTASAALIASAGLYGLYVVPLSSVLSGTTGGNGPALLLLYETLGALLAYLFQRSGGSLPLVVSTHCAFNLAVALLATRVDPLAGM